MTALFFCCCIERSDHRYVFTWVYYTRTYNVYTIYYYHLFPIIIYHNRKYLQVQLSKSLALRLDSRILCWSKQVTISSSSDFDFSQDQNATLQSHTKSRYLFKVEWYEVKEIVLICFVFSALEFHTVTIKISPQEEYNRRKQYAYITDNKITG